MSFNTRPAYFLEQDWVEPRTEGALPAALPRRAYSFAHCQNFLKSWAV